METNFRSMICFAMKMGIVFRMKCGHLEGVWRVTSFVMLLALCGTKIFRLFIYIDRVTFTLSFGLVGAGNPNPSTTSWNGMYRKKVLSLHIVANRPIHLSKP